MKDLRVDLHMHSIASDGTWTASEIVDEVKKKGIGLFAVTDHDSIGTAVQIPELVENDDLKFIMGVEVSCTHNGREHHITSYGIDIHNEAILELINTNVERRLNFDNNIIKAFAGQGHGFTYEDYVAYEEDESRGAWKCLNYLLDHKVVDGLYDFVAKIKDFDVHLIFREPKEVIEIIKKAGGMPFLAHPNAYNSRTRLPVEDLDFWKEAGVVGLECYTPYNQEGDSDYYKAYCAENDLLMSGGSDCHGNYLERKLGEPEVYLSNLDLGNLI